MSQVFSADSVVNSASTTVTTTAETSLVTGNFLNPPFANAKAVVIASIQIGVGTGTTSVAIRVRRNPSAENAQVALMSSAQITVGSAVSIAIQGVDPIPDGRPVQYAVTVQQAGASGNGTVFVANVAAFLISG